MKAAKIIVIVVVLAAVAAAAFVFLKPKYEPGEILVLCGGSMQAPMNEIKRRYAEVSDNPVVISAAGSGELCAQIENTKKGDIYVCHDPFMPWAADRNLIDRWDTLAYLDVVIIVPKGNPKGIRELKDLARPGLRIGLGNQMYSTSGQVTKHMLEKLPYRDDVLKNVRVETKGHQQRCNDVVMGTLDASIVWSAVAHLFKDTLEIIPIPKELIDTMTSATYGEHDLKNVKVTAGIIEYAKDKPHVREFYDFLLENAPEVFKEFGFRPAG